MRFCFSFLNTFYFPDFLPHSGGDSVAFELYGYQLSNGILEFANYHKDHYPRIIAFIYMLVGRKPFVIVGINSITNLIAALYVYKIITIVGNSDKKAIFGVSLFLFLPHSIIFSSVILRESLIVMFVNISLYYFILYCKSKKVLQIIISVAFIILSSVLHAGTLFVGVAYLLYFVIDKEVIRKVDKVKKPFVLVLVCSIVSCLFFVNKQIFRKLLGFDSIDTIVKIVDRNANNWGSSAYLQNFHVNNIFELILSVPIRIFYFLFSPMPWNWRGIGDVIAFFLDSIIYVYIIILLVRKLWKLKFLSSKNRIFVSCLFGLTTALSVFSLGTANAGTALRHRYKLLTLLIVLICSSVTNKKKYNKNT
jgi:hypothetical protein